MINVIVVLKDGNEILLENASFTLNYADRIVKIYKRNTNYIIAIFNFDNIAGVREI